MEVNVSGAWGKTSQKYAEAAYFYAVMLMDKRIYENLTIDIEVLKNLEVDGQCEMTDDVYPPRIFKIRLRRIAMEKREFYSDPFRVLAHEMVHVKQYAKGEMRDRSTHSRGGKIDEHVIWMGKPWKPKKTDMYPTLDAPWEIEAYGREPGLFAKYLAFERGDYKK